MQDVTATRAIAYHKILGTENPADLFTKYLDYKTIGRHCATLQYRFADGRAETAPGMSCEEVKPLSLLVQTPKAATQVTQREEDWWL